jgi:hypothetical protein
MSEMKMPQAIARRVAELSYEHEDRATLDVGEAFWAGADCAWRAIVESSPEFAKAVELELEIARRDEALKRYVERTKK